jgi:hypothetical protein
MRFTLEATHSLWLFTVDACRVWLKQICKIAGSREDDVNMGKLAYSFRSNNMSLLM